MNNTAKRLTTSAVLIALSAVLSLIILFKLPYGGSITAFSMLPVCFLAYKYGLKWGLLVGFVYGITQLLTGSAIGNPMALSAFDFILMLLLDYLIAYTCLGLTAVTRGKFKNDGVGFALGICLAAAARLLAHAASGYIFFSGWAEWFFEQDGFTFGAWVLERVSGAALSVFYAFFYNAMFLVPETIITVIMGALLIGTFKRYILDEKQ